MKTLFVIGMILILLFSFGVSGWVSFFKFPLRDAKAKVLAFLMLGAAATAFTFILCLTIIWPPVSM
ncbi:MAG: hypothetical protein CVU89_13945 [Firmicutes bacterium HGW-Firmicutes-14]|nr:MAG: hypothetical protein CVU89_13945 [Firmicutes bacterium HGW-Firmicutes-14]